MSSCRLAATSPPSASSGGRISASCACWVGVRLSLPSGPSCALTTSASSVKRRLLAASGAAAASRSSSAPRAGRIAEMLGIVAPVEIDQQVPVVRRQPGRIGFRAGQQRLGRRRALGRDAQQLGEFGRGRGAGEARDFRALRAQHDHRGIAADAEMLAPALRTLGIAVEIDRHEILRLGNEGRVLEQGSTSSGCTAGTISRPSRGSPACRFPSPRPAHRRHRLRARRSRAPAPRRAGVSACLPQPATASARPSASAIFVNRMSIPSDHGLPRGDPSRYAKSLPVRF